MNIISLPLQSKINHEMKLNEIYTKFFLFLVALIDSFNFIHLLIVKNYQVFHCFIIKHYSSSIFGFFHIFIFVHVNVFEKLLFFQVNL